VTVLNACGKFQESEAILESISKPIQNIVLDDSPEALEVLSKVSLHYLALRRGAGAEPLMQRTRENYERRLRLDNPGSLAAVGHQAHALYEAGKFDEAEELYNMVIDPMLERRDFLSADTVNNYALLLTGKGKLGKAEKMYRWSLEINRTVHGDDHPAILSCLNNIGRVLMQQEKFEEAQELFRKVLDARVKLFRQDGFYTLRSYSNLAAILFLQGKLNDEEASFRHLLEAQSKNLGTHPDIIVTMRTLASVLHINGKVRREVDATSSTRSKREFEGQGASTYTKYPE
jgi:tetratricopeptide (TPR) repeat protein